MKTALITDVHANALALAAVRQHALAAGVDDWVFLGDLVGYGPDPDEVVDIVARHAADGAHVVRGNHDEAVVAGASDFMHAEARQVVDWTRSRLDDTQLDFLRDLPLTAVRDDWLYVHANAWDPARWGYVEGRMEAMRSLRAAPVRCTAIGHVHEPRLYHLAGTGKVGEFVPVPGVAVPLAPQRRWLVVPGSCGQPRDGDPAACYALHDTADGSLTWHRVAYDHEAAAARVLAAGLPPGLALRLMTGT